MIRDREKNTTTKRKNLLTNSTSEWNGLSYLSFFIFSNLLLWWPTASLCTLVSCSSWTTRSSRALLLVLSSKSSAHTILSWLPFVEENVEVQQLKSVVAVTRNESKAFLLEHDFPLLRLNMCFSVGSPETCWVPIGIANHILPEHVEDTSFEVLEDEI